MRLRTILMALAMLTVVSTAAGAFYYFFSLRENELASARRQALARTEMVRNLLTNHLSENIKTVRILAGAREISQALLTPEEGEALADANQVLDHFRLSLEVAVCYLMDAAGDVIASSNRGDPDSFMGKNFSFRPYFREAVAGAAGTFFALGTTSMRRGAYFSHPVSRPGSDEVLGVVVIKVPITRVEKDILGAIPGVTLAVGPYDVVFGGNQRDWLLKTLWEKTPEDLAAVAASRQFGEGPWPWVGLELDEGEDLAKDQGGRQYLLFSLELPSFPGWKVVHLEDLAQVGQAIFNPLSKTTGMLVLGLCFLAGLAVLFLIRRADREIVRREEAEVDLRRAQEQLSLYSQDLERQVRHRTREINGILQYTPAVIHIKDPEGRYVLLNSRWQELFGTPAEEALGKTAYDIFPREAADVFHQNDLMVLSTKRPLQLEEIFPVGDSTFHYLSVRFPILDRKGEVIRLCGISMDITDLKKAQDSLRRLSSGIMTSQENERTAIARELHDELGQVLTVLRMDAVWLRDHLQADNPAAAARSRNMCAVIDKTISDVRHIATRLRPPALDDLGLGDALEWYATDFEKRTGIACVFTAWDLPEVPDFIALAAYRVTQEALTNVARHSGASNVEVTLAVNQDNLEVTVVDNGAGFDLDGIPEQAGLGITGMRERAYLAGGSLSIDSVPGRGTTIRLVLPLSGPGGGGD